MLQGIHQSCFLPWLCAGDFNELILDEEKLGGEVRPARQMQKFREVIQDCDLHEVQVSGSKYTWSRGKGQNAILEKLDRGMATPRWLQLFPDTIEKHLAVSSSDHVPWLFNIGTTVQQGK